MAATQLFAGLTSLRLHHCRDENGRVIDKHLRGENDGN